MNIIKHANTMTKLLAFVILIALGGIGRVEAAGKSDSGVSELQDGERTATSPDNVSTTSPDTDVQVTENPIDDGYGLAESGTANGQSNSKSNSQSKSRPAAVNRKNQGSSRTIFSAKNTSKSKTDGLTIGAKLNLGDVAAEDSDNSTKEFVSYLTYSRTFIERLSVDAAFYMNFLFYSGSYSSLISYSGVDIGVWDIDIDDPGLQRANQT